MGFCGSSTSRIKIKWKTWHKCLSPSFFKLGTKKEFTNATDIAADVFVTFVAWSRLVSSSLWGILISWNCSCERWTSDDSEPRTMNLGRLNLICGCRKAIATCPRSTTSEPSPTILFKIISTYIFIQADWINSDSIKKSSDL